MKKWITRPQTRKWLYKVLASVAGLAGAYGLLSGEEAILWLAVASSLLGLPLANAHVDTSEPEEGLGE